jgi:hypothetical protein
MKKAERQSGSPSHLGSENQNLGILRRRALHRENGGKRCSCRAVLPAAEILLMPHGRRAIQIRKRVSICVCECVLRKRLRDTKLLGTAAKHNLLLSKYCCDFQLKQRHYNTQQNERVMTSGTFYRQRRARVCPVNPISERSYHWEREIS